MLAAVLIELGAVLEAFERDGFAGLRGEWQRRHAHQGERVRLNLPDGTRVMGIARGVDASGALLLETPAGLRRYHSGEISLRPAG